MKSSKVNLVELHENKGLIGLILYALGGYPAGFAVMLGGFDKMVRYQLDAGTISIESAKFLWAINHDELCDFWLEFPTEESREGIGSDDDDEEFVSNVAKLIDEQITIDLLYEHCISDSNNVVTYLALDGWDLNPSNFLEHSGYEPDGFTEEEKRGCSPDYLWDPEYATGNTGNISF